MIYGEKYQLDKNSQVILYGAATTGAILYRCFSEHGYRVAAFIDQRADEEDTYYGRPVFSLQEAENWFSKQPEAIAVVAVKNVFEHEKIAKELWRMGCNKIVFRPYAVVSGGGEKLDDILNQAYDEILEGKFKCELYRINGFDQLLLKDQAIIVEDENEDGDVVANIPVYDVWTDDYGDKDIIWGNIPCLGLTPHIGLFRLFQGEENEDYEEYIKFCRQAAERSGGITTSHKWENSVYKNRLDVFNHMQSAWEHNREFFIQNAVKAVYHEKGYFNIVSGKHRVVFLIVMGKQYIPLRVRKSDYRKWSKEKQAAAIYELLDTYHKTELPCILDSPYFYNYPCCTPDFYGRLLNRLIGILYADEYYKNNGFHFEGKKVLLYNTPLAFYAHILRRSGFRVIIYEENEEMWELIDAVTDEKNEFATVPMKSGETYFLIAADDKEGAPFRDACAESQYVLSITNKKGQTERAIMSGFSEKGFIYAFLQRNF